MSVDLDWTDFLDRVVVAQSMKKVLDLTLRRLLECVIRIDIDDFAVSRKRRSEHNYQRRNIEADWPFSQSLNTIDVKIDDISVECDRSMVFVDLLKPLIVILSSREFDSSRWLVRRVWVLILSLEPCFWTNHLRWLCGQSNEGLSRRSPSTQMQRSQWERKKRRKQAVFIGVKVVQKWRRRLVRFLLVISSLFTLATLFFLLLTLLAAASVNGSSLRKTWKVEFWTLNDWIDDDTTEMKLNVGRFSFAKIKIIDVKCEKSCTLKKMRATWAALQRSMQRDC